MSFIPDTDLFSHSARVKGKVVIITGAANGIGKETALRFAQYGAKVVIADLDTKHAEKVVEEITSNGGISTCMKCDVTNWDEQVSLFEHAMSIYGSVDIVVPNAGIGEILGFQSPTTDRNTGKVKKPNLKTLDINLTGAVYTVHLAMHYLFLTPGTLKSIILMGSMASWHPLPFAPLYTASKHAILGLMRSLKFSDAQSSLRLACVHPFFVNTRILNPIAQLFISGIPKNTVQRVAGTVFYAATDPDEGTNAAAWLLAADGETLVAVKEEFKMGVYEMIDSRANSLTRIGTGVRAWVAIFVDVYRVVNKQILIAGLCVVVASIAWAYS